MIYAYANHLGYAYCPPCAPDGSMAFTVEPEDTCEACGARLAVAGEWRGYTGHPERTPCRIF